VKNDWFLLSALVDFPDDCNRVVFTPDLVENLIDRLHWMGVRRVYWNYYQKGMWENFADNSEATRQTLSNLGEPLALGCRLAHERGMEFYATIKPYETGASHANPQDSPQMMAVPGLPCIGGVCKVDPWVMAHPEMRVRGRSADIPMGLEKIPIERIQLRQKDMSPVRIAPENIEIWTSDHNNAYRKQDLTFALTESVETCPRDVFELDGDRVTSKGESVRALNLSGLNLLDPFIAITTNFEDRNGSFRNTAMEMVRAFGPDDEPIPIVVASHKAVWRPLRDFRTGDLEYDAGLGDAIVCLDVTNQPSVSPDTFAGEPNDGVIAIARGRNEYFSGSLCEAHIEVQAYWLSWVGACIAAGVDGLDVRISCHSSWANTPEIYGFNEPVAAEYQRRYGVNPDVEPYDPALLGALRGEFFDQFLRATKRRLSAAGKRMQVHAEMESFRPDACQSRRRTRPGNITFNWRSWLRTGLADEATLFGRGWMPEQMLNDALTLEMLREAADADVPVHLSKAVGHSRDGRIHADLLEYIYRFGGLAGYTLYETAAMYNGQHLGSDGQLQFHPGLCEGIRDRVRSLGLVD
jgi:hypothetical protein